MATLNKTADADAVLLLSSSKDVYVATEPSGRC